MKPKLKLPDNAMVLKVEGRKFYANAMDRDELRIFTILKEENPDLALIFVHKIGKLLTPLDADYLTPRR